MDKRIRTVTLGGINTDFTNPNWERRKNFADLFSGKAHLFPQLRGAVDYAKRINADTIFFEYLQKIQPSSSIKDMGKFKKPVLIISGSEDIDNLHFEDLARAFSMATVKRVAGKNHNNTMSSNNFSEYVLAFLKEH